MIDYTGNCFPGIVDDSTFCFRYNDKATNENEQYLFQSYWNEQINTYGQRTTYYVNTYNVLSADNIYGEQPARRFAPGVSLIMAIELSENANTLSKFGFQADDEITAYVTISGFYNAFNSLGLTLMTTTSGVSGNVLDTQNSQDIRTETSTVYETQFNQVQPKAGDVFAMTEYGQGRPGGRSGIQFEVTEIIDQDITKINQLGGHYVWMLKAKRFDYSFEPGLSAEAKSDQVFDNSFSGQLSGGVDDDVIPTPVDTSIDKKYPLNIDQTSKTVVFNMSANNDTAVYGGYY
jgi:hypothetical protein